MCLGRRGKAISNVRLAPAASSSGSSHRKLQRKGAKAQRRKGAKAQRRKGAKAQRRKGAKAQRGSAPATQVAATTTQSPPSRTRREADPGEISPSPPVRVGVVVAAVSPMGSGVSRTTAG